MTTTTQSRLSGMQLVILLLMLATALIHLGKGISDGLLMFIANGLGYLALAAVAYLPIAALANFKRLAKWGLLVFTAITIIGWVLIGERSALGFITKAIELVLIVLVFLDLRKSE
ncbi:MAG TPA: hypothetical protein VMP08_22420 [Anaerolineae bacterium]|nr:hypothetical protein [Anaerolineae bacterium]